jgi:hypothetical protein
VSRGPYGTPAYPVRAPRELIVRAHPKARISVARDGRIEGSKSLHAALTEANATLWPLLDDPRDAKAPLTGWYRVYPAAPQEELDHHHLAGRLNDADAIQTAFVKPPAALPVLPPAHVGARLSPGPEPAGDPDDFLPRQTYLGPAPGGIGARAAWKRPGGDGAGVRVIDVEAEWRFTHEDLQINAGGLLGGRPPGDLEWRNHGTNVLGVLGGEHNGRGVSGICAGARLQGVSFFGEGWGTAAAIRKAADSLRPGDILLLEMMRAGPNTPADAPADSQLGYVALDYWPDDFAAIEHAVRRGVIVVAAAGNGAQDLDDRSYAGFGGGKRGNPFARDGLDSGSILVGAGAPPPGTHGHDFGPDRAWMPFSNWGRAIDAQGWGREVTTTGGLGTGADSLRPGPVEDRWYTDRFSGTSSAAPIVAGALACVQGVLRAAGRQPLTPAQARAALRETGSPQAGDRSRRIGNRPDLSELIPWALQHAPKQRPETLVPTPRRKGMRVTITISDDGDGVDIVHGGGEPPYIKGPYIKGPSLIIPRDDGSETKLDIDKLEQLAAPKPETRRVR